MSWWTSILTPGLVAAGVTVLTNWWLQRPRAHLHMVVGAQTLEDAPDRDACRFEIVEFGAM